MGKFLLTVCVILGLNCHSQKLPSGKEMRMIEEINFVRTNPSGYIRYIQEYVDYWEEVDSVREIANDLIEILKELKPVSALEYSQDLYDAAIVHGIWMKKNNLFDHSDFDYAENLVSGDSLARYAVISLLIDDGVPDRGHRWNILDASYKWVACHMVSGMVGEDEYVFIQEFD
ncbi:CAP domain-containing protein [bacterium AH-315-C20]|nr:CAP domain-containing protein [bacterium AH-315-C20]